MTTSGSSNFTYNRDQIIRRALRLVGAFQSNETPDAQSVQDAADALNAMVKEWDTLGIHLWTESEGILFLQPNQIQYSMGPSATDFATQTNPPNFVQTSLAAIAAFGATSVTVASAANILVNDNIGIQCDNGAFQWTTVVSANTSTNVVTIASGLTDSASSVGLTVFDYTSVILRPLRIVDARRYNILSQIETPMIKLSRLDYRDLPNKTSSGTPTSYFYDPLGGATPFGIMYIWPAPNPVADAIRFTWYRQIQDFDNPGDQPDFPQEWINPIVWNLAVEIAPEYDIPPQRFQLLKQEATEKLERVFGWDREPESVYFGPALDYPQGRQ